MDVSNSIKVFGLKKLLGNWTPSRVEIFPVARKALNNDSTLEHAIHDAAILLVDELSHAPQFHAQCLQATVTKTHPDGRTEYYLIILVTNGDPKIPKSRVFVCSPQEVRQLKMLWELFDEKTRLAIEAMIPS